MKWFYETYNGADEKLSTLLRQISWTNNLIILSRAKTLEEKMFNIQCLMFNVFSYLCTQIFRIDNIWQK